MSGRFEGKVALITGGTSGIGRATAVAFAREGAKVAVTGRREEQGAETVRLIEEAGGEGLFVRGDVANEDDVTNAVEQTVARFGGLDACFNNAGIEGPMAPIVEQDAAEIARVLAINVTGVLISMKHQIPALLAHGGGAIVNNASVAGLVGMGGVAPYVASKHAVVGATKSVALEVAQQGVRVNAVAPAAIRTEMWDRFSGGSAEFEEQMAAMHPVGRIGESPEVASAVLWLCAPEASFVTGQTVPVDGGWTAQ
jgi:NAD(P)-dependent dehydrogenase (short-subunit alcohol dehydrogenase family)